MTPIQTRLNRGLGVFLVIALLGIGVVGSYGLHLVVEQWLLTRLDHDADSILVGLSVDDAGVVGLATPFQNPVYQRPYSGHYYQVDTRDQRIRSRSLWDAPFKVPMVAVGEVASLRTEGPEQQLLLVRIAGYEKEGQAFSIAVAEDLSPLRASIRRYQGLYLLLSAVVLGVVLVLQRRLLSRALEPLRQTTSELRQLEQGKRTALGDEVPEEVQPLVAEINRLLSVQQQRMERSRNSVGNLAHALKTPLTVMRQLIERPPLQDHPELKEQLGEQVDNLHSRIEAELRRARLAGRESLGENIQLDEELPALLAVLRSAYRDKQLRWESDLPGRLHYRGDKADMLELVGNLLDNAGKWARGRVLLSAHAGDELVLRVEDDGPGCSEAEVDTLSGRGVRLDEGVVPGHGLGLSIAQEIVESLKGTLVLGRSTTLGGFSAEVHLPLYRG